MYIKRILFLVFVGCIGVAINMPQQAFGRNRILLDPFASNEVKKEDQGEKNSASKITGISDTLIPKQYADLSLRFQHFESQVKDKSLIAAWTMDEGSGYEFSDISGNNHTAFITGYNWNTTNSGLTTSFRKTGKRGGGVYLDGSQWLQVKDSTSLNFKSAFSICLWFKPSEGSINKTTLVSRQNASCGFQLSCNKNGAVVFEYKDIDGKIYQTTSAELTNLSNKWNFITLSYNPDDNTSEIYINGKLSVSKKGVRFNAEIKGDLLIGSNNVDKENCFKGYMDEIYIYNRELTPSQIYHLYVVGLPKLYARYSATIDSNAKVWSIFGGNQIIPHTHDQNTLLLVHFNENVSSDLGQTPLLIKKQNYIPGAFGGALQPVEQLNYKVGLNPKYGTVELWVINAEEDSQPKDHKTLLKIPGVEKSGIEVYRLGTEYCIEVNDGNTITNLKSGNLGLEKNMPIHIAITWNNDRIGLWINGVLVSEKLVHLPLFNGLVELGGSGEQLFTDYIDDFKISGIAKSWGEICPSGNTDSESASLDFRDDFEKPDHTPLCFWKAAAGNYRWEYQKDSSKNGSTNSTLSQQNPSNLQVIIHPLAKGYQSSTEAGIIFSSLSNGWAGVCTNVIGNLTTFEGITFCINSKTNQIRLCVYKQGKVIFLKTGTYDFPVKIHQRYTLTLSVYNGVIKGFIDGSNLISLKINFNPSLGYGGLMTENSRADFDDVHFTAITPDVKNSRMLQAYIFSDEAKEVTQPKVVNFSFNAFRWKKRYGLLPWQRTFKDPEPPGNIFGPDADVERPNKSQSWRSEDSANSDIMVVNGTVYYCMRGNPDINGPHGSAAIGMLTMTQEDFDGIHFNDLNADELKDQKIGLLRGNKESDINCHDAVPRNERLQVNDEGMVYCNGKILIVLREFRNAVAGFSKFRRITYGLFDPFQQRWDTNEVQPVTWSVMDPSNCLGQLKGLNGTPDLTAIKDLVTGQTIILMYFEQDGKGMVTGLSYDGKSLQLHPDYPPKASISKSNNDRTYGQRLFFDNGIYYINVNSGSDKAKLKVDWPDKFELFSSLNPYSSSWIESADNSNETRSYFTRGNENDPDNGAIWQGTIFKYRNHYFMYYENYHSVNDINKPYDQYDKVNSGSRVGFATGN